MPLSDRHAPEDTAIRRENLDANLQFHSIGRYYPEEYGSQIQASVKKHDLIADIPATLAGIVIDRNDHALSSWANQERLQQYEDESFYKQLEANKRQLLDLDADLKVHDKTMQMQSDLIKARETALANDGNIEEAYRNVYANYENIFDGTPALASRFNKEFQASQKNNIKAAILEDIQNNQFKLANNIKDAFNNINKEIVQGNLGAIDGFKQLVTDTAKWYKYMPANAVTQFLEDAFNSYVKEQALFTVNQFKEGNLNAQTAMDTLRGLHDVAQNFSTNLVDEEGNILKDDKGNDRTANFTLNIETQNYLEQALKDIKSGGSGNGGDGILPDIVNDYNKKIGYNQIKKEGYSEYLLSVSDDDYKNHFLQVGMSILNSGASETSKAKNLNEIYQSFMTGAIIREVNKLAKENKDDSSTIFIAFANQLNKDLKSQNFTGDWETYNPKITIKDKTYNLGFAALTKDLQQTFGDLGLLPRLGSSQQEASLFWQDTQNILREAANSLHTGNTSNFMIKHDPNYNATSQNLLSDISETNLLKINDKTKQIGINIEGKVLLTNDLQSLKESANKMGLTDTISPEQMDKYVDNAINNTTDPLKKYKILETFGASLLEAGCSSDIYKYAKYKQSQQGSASLWSSKEDTYDNNLLAIYTIRKVPNLNRSVQNMIANGTYAENAKAIKDNKQEHIITDVLEKVCDSMHITKEDRGMYRSLANLIAANSVTNIKTGAIDKNTYKNQLTEVLNQLYVTIPNKLGKNNGLGNKALLREASYIQPFITNTGEIDTNKLNVMTTEAISLISNSSFLHPTINKYLNNPDFYPDVATGTIRLRFNGEDVKDSQGNIIGGLIYTPELKKVNAKEIGQATAMQVMLNTFLPNAHEIYTKEYQTAKSSASLLGVSDNYLQKQLGTESNFIKMLKTHADILNDSKKVTKLLLQAQTNNDNGSIQNINTNYNLPYTFSNLVTPSLRKTIYTESK